MHVMSATRRDEIESHETAFFFAHKGMRRAHHVTVRRVFRVPLAHVRSLCVTRCFTSAETMSDQSRAAELLASAKGTEGVG